MLSSVSILRKLRKPIGVTGADYTNSAHQKSRAEVGCADDHGFSRSTELESVAQRHRHKLLGRAPLCAVDLKVGAQFGLFRAAWQRVSQHAI